MSTTLAAARTEMSARGLDHLSDSRVDSFLNQAHREVCNAAFWPFTEASASGAAPLTVSDLRVVRYVTDTDTDTRIPQRSRHWLNEVYGDLTTTGTPDCYYVDSGSIVRTYPVGGTIEVYYYKKPTILDETSDTFLVPDDYMDIVYEFALARGMSDMGDYQAAAAVRASATLQLDSMRLALCTSTDGPADFIRVRSPE